jgi:hypothetical protein
MDMILREIREASSRSPAMPLPQCALGHFAMLPSVTPIAAGTSDTRIFSAIFKTN